jgi:hypothetical protein
VPVVSHGVLAGPETQDGSLHFERKPVMLDLQALGSSNYRKNGPCPVTKKSGREFQNEPSYLPENQVDSISVNAD